MILKCLCVLLLIAYFSYSLDADTGREYWLKEINASLAVNIRSNCNWTMSRGFSVPHDSSNTFLVSPFLPHKTEMNLLQSLPVSLTKANKELIDVLHLAKIGNETHLTKVQWAIPEDHPAQKRMLCYNLTKLASREGILDLYQSFRSVERSFYLLRNRRGIIAPDGTAGFNCGYFQGKEGCETRWDHRGRKWHAGCSEELTAVGLDWESPWASSAAAKDLSVKVIKNCTTDWNMIQKYGLNMTTEHLFKPTFHKRVFLLENQWDYNYHHFMADCLARLARNLKFLRANPDVMIHIRSMEEYDTPPFLRSDDFKQRAKRFRDGLFQLLGISPDRVVFGLVLADEVYIPRVMHCAYALSNPIEIRALAKELLLAVHDSPHAGQKALAATNPNKKKRYSGGGNSERNWNNATTKLLAQEFAALFPDHNVVVQSSLDVARPYYCLTCEILMFSQADILVGNHGAGLTSAMFMPPGALVVEVVAQFNNVNMPVCGYYGPWGSMFGHHHYLHGHRYKAGEPLRPAVLAAEARRFYQELHWKNREQLNVTRYSHHPDAIVDPETGQIA